MFRANQLLGRVAPDAPVRMASTTDGDDATPPDAGVAILATRSSVETCLVSTILARRGYRVVPTRSAEDLARAISGPNRDALKLVVAEAAITGGPTEALVELVEQQTKGLASVVLIGDDRHRSEFARRGEAVTDDWFFRPLDYSRLERRLDRRQGSGPGGRDGSRVWPPQPVPRSSAPRGGTLGEQVSVAETTKGDLVPIPDTADAEDSNVTPWLQTDDDTRRDAHRVVLQAFDEALPTDSGRTDRTLDPRYQIEKGIDSRAALLYREAFDYLSACAGQVHSGEPLQLNRGFDISSRFVDCLEGGNDLLLLATDRDAAYSWRQHSVNVSILAAQTAATMKLPAETVLKIAFAGLMHDLGTLRLPTRLTFQMARTDKGDKAEIRRRPLYSAELLSGEPSFAWLPGIVARVYERENGKGYPDGVRGDQIPLEAKVLGVVDVFEACIHSRP